MNPQLITASTHLMSESLNSVHLIIEKDKLPDQMERFRLAGFIDNNFIVKDTDYVSIKAAASGPIHTLDVVTNDIAKLTNDIHDVCDDATALTVQANLLNVCRQLFYYSQVSGFTAITIPLSEAADMTIFLDRLQALDLATKRNGMLKKPTPVTAMLAASDTSHQNVTAKVQNYRHANSARKQDQATFNLTIITQRTAEATRYLQRMSYANLVYHVLQQNSDPVSRNTARLKRKPEV